MRVRVRAPLGGVLGTVGLIVVVLVVLVMAAHWGWRLDRAFGVVPAFGHDRWNAARDRSVAEMFGYLELTVSALLLGAVAVRTRAGRWFLLTVAVGLLVLVMDDALGLHERAGRWLADRVDLPTILDLRGQDTGEVLVWVVFGALLAVALSLGYLGSASERPLAHRLALAFLPIVVFGFALDVVEALVVDAVHAYVTYVLVWVEATGELIGMSAVLLVALHRWLQSRGNTS